MNTNFLQNRKLYKPFFIYNNARGIFMLTEKEKKEHRKISNAKQYQKIKGMLKIKRDAKLEKPTSSIRERFTQYEDNGVLSIGYNEGSFEYDHDCIIFPVGDPHLGSTHTRYLDVLNCAELVRDTEHLYTVLMGDYADNFKKHSPGGGIWEQVIPPAKAIQEVTEIVDIMKDKVIGVVAGCHDLWDFQSSGKKFARELSDRCPNSYWLGVNGYINIKVGVHTYRIYASHKYLGGSKYNICHGIASHFREVGDFDIGFGAHRHQPGIFVPYIRGKFVYCIRSTSFKVTDVYIKSKGYQDSPKASPCVILRHETKTIEPYMFVKDAIKRL